MPLLAERSGQEPGCSSAKGKKENSGWKSKVKCAGVQRDPPSHLQPLGAV